MANREIWKRTVQLEERTRWSKRDFLYFLKEFKRNKRISQRHPKRSGFYDFVGVNLRKTRIPNVTIADADFDFAQFYCSGIRNARVSGTTFLESDLCSVDAAFAIFDACNLTGARLLGANLFKATFISCDFSASNLALSDLREAKFVKCVFSSADFYKVKNISSAVFEKCSFSDSSINRETFGFITDKRIREQFEREGLIMDYEYDVAISFAGEDRRYAEDLANALRKSDVRVFFDEFETARLWGKNLYDYHSEIYEKKAKHCVMIISTHYARKAWPNLERKSAQARVFQESDEYILPIRLDDTQIRGILPTIGFINSKDHSVNDIVHLIKEKLRN